MTLINTSEGIGEIFKTFVCSFFFFFHLFQLSDFIALQKKPNFMGRNIHLILLLEWFFVCPYKALEQVKNRLVNTNILLAEHVEDVVHQHSLLSDQISSFIVSANFSHVFFLQIVFYCCTFLTVCMHISLINRRTLLKQTYSLPEQQ